MHIVTEINLIAAASGKHASEALAQPSAANPALQVVATLGVGVLVLGMLLCLYRMIRGQHLADRVLAGDTMAMLVAGLVIVLAVKYSTSMFYDTALVVSILGFASTVAFAQYIGAKNKSSEHPEGPAEVSDPDPESDAEPTGASKEVSA